MGAEDDRIKFQQVVMPFLSEGYALARWIAGNQADADDILQDACVLALRGIATYAGGSARAWTLTIVRRTAYTWLGKNRSPKIVALDDLSARDRDAVERGGDFCSVTTDTPEAELIAKADAKQLESAIARLPLEFREAIILRDIHGLDYREISEVTEAPIGTVMSRLARARRRLMAAIVEHE